MSSVPNLPNTLKYELDYFTNAFKGRYYRNENPLLPPDTTIKFVWDPAIVVPSAKNRPYDKFRQAGEDVFERNGNLFHLWEPMSEGYGTLHFHFALISNLNEPWVAMLRYQVKGYGDQLGHIYILTNLDTFYFQTNRGAEPYATDTVRYVNVGFQTMRPILAIIWPSSMFEKLKDSTLIQHDKFTIYNELVAWNEIDSITFYLFPMFPLSALNHIIEGFEGESAFKLDFGQFIPQEQETSQDQTQDQGGDSGGGG